MLAENDSLLSSDRAAITENSDPLTGGISFTDGDRILQVTSQGEVTIPTSITTVDLGIQVQAPTATEAQQELAQQSANVIDVLEDLGAQELQTTSVQLYPVYSYEDDTERLIGFESRNTLEFELQTEEAGSAIDAAIEAGANLVENVSFSASDEALQQARQQALTQAVAEAQTQAQTVFNALDLVAEAVVGIEIVSVDETDAFPPLVAFEADSSGATTPIIGGPQTVEATVALDILYAPASDASAWMGSW